MKNSNRKRKHNRIALGLYAISGIGLVAIAVLAFLMLTQQDVVKRQLNLVAWNVESGGNNPQVIAMQMQNFSGFDVVALNEVNSHNVEEYSDALGPHYQAFVSRTGRSDRLAIIFNSTRFELLQSKEMAEYREYNLNNGNHRSPIFVRLKDRESGLEFVYMTNHLSRGDAKLRQQQAIGLREWARNSSVPIIAMGDFNFDYSFQKHAGNEAFNDFMRDGVWEWIKPDPLIDTQWSDDDGVDRYPDSLLDFVFVAGAAKDFIYDCKVVVLQGDFPDTEETSDHRPVKLVVELPSR